MANTKGSDNPFPSILVVEGTEPAAPSAGQQRLYIDSTTHKLKRTNSSGTDVDIEASAGGSGTLTTIEEVDGSPTDSAVTKLVLPNGTLAIASHVATYTPPAADGFLQASRVTRTAGDVTTTSTTFVDLTGASITLTTGAHRCLILFTGIGYNTAVGARVSMDIDIGGSRVGGTLGIVDVAGAASNERNMSFTFLTDVLSAGSHTFKVQWRVSSGTGTIAAASADSPYLFTVIETGLAV